VELSNSLLLNRYILLCKIIFADMTAVADPGFDFTGGPGVIECSGY